MEKKINTPYNSTQVLIAIDKEMKQRYLDDLLKCCEGLLRDYLKSDTNSINRKDKQLSCFDLVLFEKNDSYLVYRYTGAGREWVVEYKK